MKLLAFLLALISLLICTTRAAPFGAESATEAFISHFSDHVQREMESLLKEHILRDIDKDLNETMIKDALVSDLGPELSHGFRPQFLWAFEKGDEATRVSKNPRNIRESARKAFEELQMEWMDHSAKTMAEWAERQPDLAATMGKPSLGSDLVPLDKRRFMVGGFGGVWDVMMKTIITWEFMEILFAVFAMIGALFGAVGHHRHARIVYDD